MTGRILFITIMLIMVTSSSGQTIEDVRVNFESFEYNSVIELSNSILGNDSTLLLSDKIDLLIMKGVSFYSIAEIDSSRATFIDLLKLDPTHSLDPVRISPKIISFFNTVKNEFEEISSAAMESSNHNVSTSAEISVFNNKLYTNSIVRSLILPGLGHLYAENKSGNWLLTSLSAANLGAMIYFIVETNNREQKYLNETSLSNIAGRYDDYNESYKIRNILIASYAAIWLYSQIDLMFNSDELFLQTIKPEFSMKLIENSHHFSFNFIIPLQ